MSYQIFLLLFGCFLGYLLGWAGHRTWLEIKELQRKANEP